nr:hypothetical protein [uncultured Desulfobacter sp.]
MNTCRRTFGMGGNLMKLFQNRTHAADGLFIIGTINTAHPKCLPLWLHNFMKSAEKRRFFKKMTAVKTMQ